MEATVVNRYARAFVSVIAGRPDALKVSDELTAIVKAFTGQPDVMHYFLNPAVRLQEKEEAMSRMLKRIEADDTIQRLLLALVQNNRVDIMRFLPDAVRRFLFERLGMVEVQLTVPLSLDEKTRQRFQEAFELRTGKQVVLSVREDPDILGGAVARIGSTLIDGSLKTNLKKLRENLTGDI